MTDELPRRVIHGPVICAARMLPAGMPSNARPSRLSDSPACTFNAGIRLASEPWTTPSSRKTTAVARRAPVSRPWSKGGPATSDGNVDIETDLATRFSVT